jgi:hypothetical protein
MIKNLRGYVLRRLNISSIIAIILTCVLIGAYHEIISTLRWFISTQLRVLLSDKEILIAIVTFIIALFHKK